MHCHGRQALHLGMSFDDGDPAAMPAQLSCDMVDALEVVNAVGQDHQIARGSLSSSLQLIDNDVTLSGEHRYAAQRSDGLSQPRTGDHGQDTSLTNDRNSWGAVIRIRLSSPSGSAASIAPLPR